MITAESILVKFGGVTALDMVDVGFERGEIVGVIGPNGSGKSTLFNVITGFVRPVRGIVRLDDKDITRHKAHKRANLGLARTFQTPRVDFTVSVREAVMCGYYPTLRAGMLDALVRSPRQRAEERNVSIQAEGLLERFGLEDYGNSLLAELPMGLVRMVEVARAMAHSPAYLLLDEPAAGLTKAEQALLISEIKRLAKSGVGVLLVEHNFGLVEGASDRIVVLDRGAVLARGTAAEVSANREVVNAYLGKPAETKRKVGSE